MQWLRRHFANIVGVFILSLAVLLVAWRNYTPGTFLTGIDNFHIEFNLGLAWQRAWSGVWQENQGLGIVSGLAQMTEMPRIVIYKLLGWVLPPSLVRYSYVFLNLYVGVLGVYLLTKYLSKSRLGALAGALFYLFNLGTVQVFFMPTEMFVVNFVALPWLFLLVLKYLSEGRRASLAWYAGLLFLFAPMAMTPTIFVVYLLFLGITVFVYFFSREKWDVKWERSLGIVGVTVGISLYFLLPFANFALNNARVLTESKINSVFSQENYLANAGRSSWSDLALLKGMWFDYPDNVDGKLVPLLGAWEDHLYAIGYLVYVPVAIIGIGIVGLLWKRRWQGIGIVIMGLVAILLLRGENPPLGGVIAYLRSLPMIAEAFRTPYTKIAPILLVVYGVGFGYGVYLLSKVWRWKIGSMLWKGILIGGMMGGLIWLNRPYFNGKLISDGVRVKIPNEYFEMFKFFQSQNTFGRVVRMPAHTSQAWDYTDWGYRGSGFLWYGIEQPILDRAFDVWSPYNERFYNQISTALYGCESDNSQIINSLPAQAGQILKLNCGEQVQKVLEQYDVKYVLLDESVIAPGQGKEILRIEETKKLADELGWEMVFNEGFLSVWDVSNSQITNDKFSSREQWISAPETYTLAEGETAKVRDDVIFDELGTYVEYPVRSDLVGFDKDLQPTRSDLESQGAVIFPFAQLMREEAKSVEWGEGAVKIISNLNFSNSQMIVPGWEVGEIVRLDFATSSATTLGTRWDSLPAYYVNGYPGPRFLGKERPMDGKSYFYARVSEGEEWREYRSEQKFEIRNVKLEIEVRGEPFVYDFAKQGQGSIGNCDVLKRGVAEKIINPKFSNPQIREQGTGYVADERGAVCDYVVMEEVFVRVPYLMRVRGENAEGRSVKFFLWNTGSKRNDIEYLLGKEKFDQTFALLPWDWDGYYTLNIETRSFGQRAENRIEPVVGMYVPLEKIARAKLVGAQNGEYIVTNNADITYVKKTGTWLYGLGVKGDGLIRLSQGYDEGWVAFALPANNYQLPITNLQKLTHVKVDGWANGFVINNEPGATSNANQIVVIFYWPQLLQYLGLVMLGITVLGLWLPVRLRGR